MAMQPPPDASKSLPLLWRGLKLSQGICHLDDQPAVISCRKWQGQTFPKFGSIAMVRQLDVGPKRIKIRREISIRVSDFDHWATTKQTAVLVKLHSLPQYFELRLCTPASIALLCDIEKRDDAEYLLALSGFQFPFFTWNNMAPQFPEHAPN